MSVVLEAALSQTKESGPPAMLEKTKQIRIRTLLGWGVFGQLVYVASQFFTLLALTQFATIQEVGIFGLASAVVIPIFFFFDLSMRVNVAASARSDYSFQDFRTLLLASVSVGFGVVLLLGFSMFEGSGRAILLILGFTKMAESISNFSYGVFQRFDRINLVAESLILRSVGGTILFVLLLANGAPVETAFLAQLLVWCIVALGVDHRRARKLWRHHSGQEGLDVARILRLAGSSFLLALSGLLSALQGNMPRYVIAWLLDVVALGQFTVVGYAMQAISTVTMAATQSLVSRITSFIEEGRRNALWRTLGKLLAGLAVFTVFSVGTSLLVGDWLVQAVFGPEYADLGTLLTICLLAASLRAVVLILQMCLLAARQYKLNLIIRICTATLMLLACLAGGMFGGLTGIVWGMCAAFVLHISALALAVRTLAAK